MEKWVMERDISRYSRWQGMMMYFHVKHVNARERRSGQSSNHLAMSSRLLKGRWTGA
jgi:hypothetical protein